MNAALPNKVTGEPLFQRVALLGAGLIGSSLAWAIRERGLADHVAAYSRRAETRASIERLGFADSLHSDPAAAVTGVRAEPSAFAHYDGDVTRANIHPRARGPISCSMPTRSSGMSRCSTASICPRALTTQPLPITCSA